jgi:hypothetical protein
LGTLALGCTFNVVNLALVELGVVDLDDAVALKAVLGLSAFTIFEEDALIPCIFVPRSKVFVNVEVGLELGLPAEAEAPLALNCLKE